jgi:hypothetical protein
MSDSSRAAQLKSVALRLFFLAFAQFLKKPKQDKPLLFRKDKGRLFHRGRVFPKTVVMSAALRRQFHQATRRSSVFLRFTSAFFSSRSTATLIDPGVSHTLGPIVLTGNGPL